MTQIWTAQSFWNYLWYLVSLIHEAPFGALYDINSVPLSWTCLNFPTGKGFFRQAGLFLFLYFLTLSSVPPLGQHKLLSLLCPQLSFLSESHPGAHYIQWYQGGGLSHNSLISPCTSWISVSYRTARLQQSMVSQQVPLTQSHLQITFYIIDPAVRICLKFFHLASCHPPSL